MKLFLTNKFEYNISGIEKAQLYRWQLFRELKVSSRIVTFDFIPELDRFLYRNNVPQQASLNMFDYWQHLNYSEVNSNTIENFKDHNRINDSIFTRTLVEYFDKRTIPEYLLNGENIKKRKLFDQDNNLLQVEIWDVRGFVSERQFFEDGIWKKNVWYTNYGLETVVEEPGKIILTKANPQAQNKSELIYNSWIEVKAAWLDHLVDIFNEVTIFEDRGDYTTPIVLKMNKKAAIYRVLHSAHTRDRLNPLLSPLNDSIQMVVDNSHRYTGMIVSTDQQRKDLMARTDLPVFTVPVAYVPNNPPLQKHISKGKVINLLYLSRVSREKNIEDAISVVDQLVNVLQCNVVLNIYGFVSDLTYYQELVSMISYKKLEKNVYFNVFTTNLTSVFEKSDIFILTSHYEGFNMSILEAAHAGIPFVAYDINYGPKYLSQKIKNGILIEPGNTSSMANEILSLIDSTELYAKLSNNSIQNSIIAFSKKSISKIWLKFLSKNGLVRIEPKTYIVNQYSNEELQLSSIINDLGLQNVPLPTKIGIENWLQQFISNDKVILEYPFSKFVNDLDSNDILKIITLLRQVGVKVALMVRGIISSPAKAIAENELSIFNTTDVIVVSNNKMREWLKLIGVRATVYNINIDTWGLMHRVTTSLELRPFKLLNIREENESDISRTLDESKFQIESHIINSDFEHDSLFNDLYLRHVISLIDDPYDFDGFGLVWPGEIFPQNGLQGIYSQINIPRIANFYQSLGIPIITWSGSELARQINKYGNGIVVNQLYEIDSVMANLDQPKLENIKKSANHIRSILHSSEIFKGRLMELVLNLSNM